ncbi:UNVERIFIED_CONTAM: hypothetical protein Slati_3948200 [Sesamum latifolium]|uniref:Retrovirus-related Pol polyprotein from transposon TNT 1-94-like beta-barrel domain-containing protein n=1 Tax=Sesamum latifolium TaxID=2727402 RepID=A0AAW2TPD2_9LAMI
MKLGFIDGSFPRPAVGSTSFKQWRRVDLMVTSWIWNSMSKDIVESFMYCATSRELWIAIQVRYGRSNGPMIYQLQREISTVSQQDLDLTTYLTKATKLWNELSCLKPAPRFEKQRMVQTELEVNSSNVAYQKKGKEFFANVDVKEESIIPGPSRNVSDMMAELLKVLQKNTTPIDPISNYANYAHFDEEFAGNTTLANRIDLNCWIINSGATNLVCANIALFHSYAKPDLPHFIHLPDGSKRLVQYIGSVHLKHNITLNNVFFVPQFCVNLLSISQLCSQTNYQPYFTKDRCLLQDQDTKQTLVMGKIFQKLYIYKDSHSVSAEASVPSELDVTCTSSIPCNPMIWQNRFGHASMQAINIFWQLIIVMMLVSFLVTYATELNSVGCLFLDVQFYEDIFPYSDTQFQSSSPPLPAVPLSTDHASPTLDHHTDPIPQPITPASPSAIVPPPISVTPTTDHPLPRRSTRQIHKPAWLGDFVSHAANPSLLLSSNTAYSLFVASLSVL